MPHQDKSQKCYLDLGINLEWPKVKYRLSLLCARFTTTQGKRQKTKQYSQ